MKNETAVARIFETRTISSLIMNERVKWKQYLISVKTLLMFFIYNITTIYYQNADKANVVMMRF